MSPIRKTLETKVDYVVILRHEALTPELRDAVHKIKTASRYNSTHHVGKVGADDLIIAVQVCKGFENDAHGCIQRMGYFFRELMYTLLTDLDFDHRADKTKLRWPPFLALSAQNCSWDVYMGEPLLGFGDGMDQLLGIATVLTNQYGN